MEQRELHQHHQTSRHQMQLTGETRRLSTQSRIKANAAHAGHSQQSKVWNHNGQSSTTSSTHSLNKTLSTALSHAMAAMVVSWNQHTIMLSNTKAVSS